MWGGCIFNFVSLFYLHRTLLYPVLGHPPRNMRRGGGGLYCYVFWSVWHSSSSPVDIRIGLRGVRMDGWMDAGNIPPSVVFVGRRRLVCGGGGGGAT